MANEAVKKQADPAKEPVLSIVQSAKSNLQARLPKGIDRDRFFLGILTAIQKSKSTAQAGKSLADCDPNAVLLAAYDAAECGCSLSPALQLGWLIPYGKECNFQPSYRFFIQKAYETGEVKTFYAEVVYATDKFDRQFAPKRNLFHAPGDGERSMKTALGAYAFIEFTDGTVDWEYLTAEQIDRHRKHSKQPNSMKWVSFWEEGWRITPIRVLAKRLPLKSRTLEDLVDYVNRDAERDLVIPLDNIVEPSIPRRISETEKEKPAAPAEKTAQAQQEPQQEQKPKEDHVDAATEKQEPARAEGSQAGGSMFAEGDSDPFLTPAEINEFWSKVFSANCKKSEVIELLKKNYKASAPKDLRRSQAADALNLITQARP